jgi:hypothetical protein
MLFQNVPISLDEIPNSHFRRMMEDFLTEEVPDLKQTMGTYLILDLLLNSDLRTITEHDTLLTHSSLATNSEQINHHDIK